MLYYGCDTASTVPAEPLLVLAGCGLICLLLGLLYANAYSLDRGNVIIVPVASWDHARIGRTRDDFL